MSFCTWNNGFAYEYEGTYQNKKNAITEAKKIRRQGKRALIKPKRNYFGKTLYTVWACKWKTRY